MDNLAIITNETDVTASTEVVTDESVEFSDILGKYDLNSTEKTAIDLKVNEGLDYKDIAVRMNKTANHICRVLNTDKVSQCIAELKNIRFSKGLRDLTDLAYNEAVRLLKDKDTPVKQRVDLIKHILPEGKKNIDLNLGQQEKQNW